MGERKRTNNSKEKKNDIRPRGRGTSKVTPDQINLFYDGMWNEIVGVLVIAISLLMIAGIFTDKIGKVGRIMRDLDFSIFGKLGYLFPFLLLIFGIILIIRKTSLILNRRFLGLSLLLLILLVFFSVPFTFRTKGQTFNEAVRAIATSWSTDHGGIFGYIISLPMVRLFGEIGSYLLLILATFVSIILILNMTLNEGFTKLNSFIKTSYLYISETINELKDRRREKRKENEVDKALLDDGFKEHLENANKNEGDREVTLVDKINRKGDKDIGQEEFTEDLLEKYKKYREKRLVNEKNEGPKNFFINSLDKAKALINLKRDNKEEDLDKEILDRDREVPLGKEGLLDSLEDDKGQLDKIASKLKDMEISKEVKESLVEKIELPSFLNTGRKHSGEGRERSSYTTNKDLINRYNIDLERDSRNTLSHTNDKVNEVEIKKEIPKLRLEDLKSYREGENEGIIPSDDPILGANKNLTKAENREDKYDELESANGIDLEEIPYLEEDLREDKTKKTAIARHNPKKDEGSIIEPLKGRQLKMDDKEIKKQLYKFPKLDLLRENIRGKIGEEEEKEIVSNAKKLQETLESFGVEAKVLNVSRGPSVTRYELQPKAGIKVSKITNLADDIALSLAASGVRIEAPIPGKAAVGIEIPNKETRPVFLREVLESERFQKSSQKLAIALGEDISGESVIGDMAKFPHVLIAGATGSGKSVCINSLIVSLLFKYSPDEVRLIMVDPKVVELSVYNGIPHLLIPVVTDPKKATGALHWAVTEMTRRYQLFAENSVKNLEGYNALYEKGKIEEKIPYIVIIVDELADLMMVSANEVEDYILRLSQMARAAGMHLVIATQRPSVDVITGVIKANIPSRISFAVSSYVDSKTILDQSGAEKLLGKGDMLYYPVGAQKPRRVQGAFISEEEVEAIVDHIKESEDEVQYDESVLEHIESGSRGESSSQEEEEDELLDEAISTVVEAKQASTSFLQRKLKIGYSRAARIMDSLEAKGVISGPDGSKPRKVIWTMEDI